MYTELLFTTKLTKFLGSIIHQFNLYSKNEFLLFSKQVISKRNHPDNILSLFYFEKFFPFLKKTELILDFEKLDKNYANEIEDFIIHEFVSLDRSDGYFNIKNFLNHYGNFRKSVLNKLFLQYEQLEAQKFLDLSKIFLINDYQQNDWKKICLSNIGLIERYSKDSLSFKLFENLGIQGNSLNLSTNETISQTQSNLKEHLRDLNLKIVEEFQRDYYQYDFYLPDLDVIIEFDGPDHFYPLQTQLKEKYKFRYKNISEKFKSKIILIPFYEYMRYDTKESILYYLSQLIKSDFEIKNGPLFHENYDTFAPLRNYKKLNKSSLI